MRAFDIAKIESAFGWLQNEFSDTDVQQSIDALIQKTSLINATLAWAYEQMAIAKIELNKAKEKAYIELNAKSVTMKQLYSPSLAKDYINAKCSCENYNYDIVERLCRALVHISDNLRTSISALKVQAGFEQTSY